MSHDIERIKSIDTESYVRAVESISEYIQSQLTDTPSLALFIGDSMRDVTRNWFAVEKELVLPESIVNPALVVNNTPFATIRKIGEQRVFCVESGVYGEQAMPQLALPVRVTGILGIPILTMITAVCSLKSGINPGEICIITDHINLLGNSPLVGENIDEWGPRFPDMTEPYDLDLRQHCLDVVSGKLHESVLSVIPMSMGNGMQQDGLDYLSRLGGDIVGFDVVPEVITARHMDLRVLGIACIRDFCVDAQMTKQPLAGTAAADTSRSLVHALLHATASLT